MMFVVDMNLSPRWSVRLAQSGHSAVHWSAVGDADAVDDDIMAWAQANGAAVLTHDLDFGRLLAQSKAKAPSVILLRVQDTAPEAQGDAVADIIRDHIADLSAGALIVYDQLRARVRSLPFP